MRLDVIDLCFPGFVNMTYFGVSDVEVSGYKSRELVQ
jgi:hypothetical protein